MHYPRLNNSTRENAKYHPFPFINKETEINGSQYLTKFTRQGAASSTLILHWELFWLHSAAFLRNLKSAMIGNGISIWEQRPWKLCSIFGHQIHLFTQQTQWCKVSSLISVWPATLQLWTINLQASDPTVSDQLWAHRTSLNFVNHSKLCNFFLKSYPLFYCCLCPAGIFSDLWILGRQRAELPKWHRGKESL